VRIPIVLSIGLLLTAVAIAVAVSRAPLVALASSPTTVEKGMAAIPSNATVCQTGETLPAGTSAIRFPIGSAYGPSIKVEATQEGHVLTSGSRGSEWVGPTAIAVTPLKQTASNATVCFKVGAVTEGTTLSGGKAGKQPPATINGQALPGRTRIEYLRPGAKSWASLASTVARHMGFGNASGGSGIVFLLIALMGIVIALTARSLIGDLR
jgi:hypothetical protein